jgi:hypothetical protein
MDYITPSTLDQASQQVFGEDAQQVDCGVEHCDHDALRLLRCPTGAFGAHQGFVTVSNLHELDFLQSC